MASSEVEIVNSAFVKIAEDAIVGLTDDSKRARTANRQYPLKRDALQRRYRWNFCIKRDTLAPDSVSPPFGFESRFLLPADYNSFIGMFDAEEPDTNYTSSTIPFKVEAGRFLHTDGDTAEIVYLAKITDVAQFDSLFVECLAWLLAQDMALALTSGLEYVKLATLGYKDALREAKMAAAFETSPEVLTSSDWLDSRSVTGRGPFRAGPII